MEQYFLSMKEEFPILTTSEAIFEDFNSSLSKWTWNTTYREITMDGKPVLGVTLTLYTPGHITHGYFVTSPNLYMNEAKKCLFLICNEQLLTKAPSFLTAFAKTETNVATKQTSQEDILKLVEQSVKQVEPTLEPVIAPTKINSSNELNNDKREEIPFEDLGNNVSTMESKVPVSDLPENPKAFSQKQESDMLALKERLHKADPSEDVELMMSRFINTWNPKLSKKQDLTNRNIDDFIAYSNNILSSMGK